MEAYLELLDGVLILEEVVSRKLEESSGTLDEVKLAAMEGEKMEFKAELAMLHTAVLMETVMTD